MEPPGLTLMTFGFVFERFGLFLHVLRANPSHAGRDLSFRVGIAFNAQALWVAGFSSALAVRRW